MVFSSDPREMVERFGFKLGTAHFEPGDCLIFGLHFMHSSIPNRSNRFRISIDTRYQLAREPSDERFHGPNGSWLGNFHTPNAKYQSLNVLRVKWGLESNGWDNCLGGVTPLPSLSSSRILRFLNAGDIIYFENVSV